MSEARRLLEALFPIEEQEWLREARGEIASGAVGLCHDVPTMLGRLAESRAREGELVAALEEQGSERGDGLWHILGCPARLFHPQKCAPRCQMARDALGEKA